MPLASHGPGVLRIYKRARGNAWKQLGDSIVIEDYQEWMWSFDRIPDHTQPIQEVADRAK